MKKNIAIIYGGYSSEKEVSEKSAAGIYSFIDKDKYNVFKVKIECDAWLVDCGNAMINVDKNDFSFSFDGQKTKFDFAYNTIHGTPGEDGTLQGYFDMLQIPYSNCGVLASALTFNKFACKLYLKNFGIEVPDSVVIRKNNLYCIKEITSKLKFPVFVKPNVGGSSIATTKVEAEKNTSILTLLSHFAKQRTFVKPNVSKSSVTATKGKKIQQEVHLEKAIKEAFNEAPEVIIEQFISGTEVTCGCLEYNERLKPLPITEIVSKNEFFDYNAKYKGEVEEITPARISTEMTKTIRETTKKIYHLIDAKGIIRVDYIISNNKLILLEVNTTPGMTSTSLIPQQIAKAKLDMKRVLSHIIELEYNKVHQKQQKYEPKF